MTTAIKDLIPDAMRMLTTTAKSVTTTFEPDFDAYEPSLVAAKEAVRQMVADMEHGAEPYWLTLVGVNGCGKTCLGRQLHREAKRINPGNPLNSPIWPPSGPFDGPRGSGPHHSERPYALWLDEGGLVSRMRAGHYNYPRSLQNDFFVGLDEIGCTRDPTNFVSEAVGMLAESRLGRWSFFASNFSLTEIAARMDARISSRMVRAGSKVVTIKAGDYALRKKAIPA